jgi:hypothetical protein
LTGSGGHKSTVGQTIQLNLNSHATPKQVETALNHWYGNQARRLLPNRVKLVRETLKEQHFPSSELKFRKMKRRWGSCSKAKKSILLNTELIKAPVECIDYVIVHELCHLKIANHSKDFYALLGVCLPNWKKWKDELENGNYLS